MVCPSGQTISPSDIFLKPKDRIKISKTYFFIWSIIFEFQMKLNFYYLNFVKSKGLLSIVNAPAQIIVTAPGIKNVPPSIATTTTTNSRKRKSKSFIQPISKSFYWWKKLFSELGQRAKATSDLSLIFCAFGPQNVDFQIN